MEKQLKFDEAMIDVAITFSRLSHAKRNKVGCVIAKDNRIIANGYNGTLPGLSNDCEVICPKCDGTGLDCKHCQGNGYVTSEFVLHAEQNAISYCAKNGIALNGATLYITLSPCSTCAKMIAACGITRVVYLKHYRNNDGVEYLKKCNIKAEKI